MRQNNSIGLVKHSRSEKQTEVVEVIGEGRGGDIKVALKAELTAKEGTGRRALVREGKEALESGEERREKSLKKRVLGPERGIGERGKRGLERG
jgi:hypothetical protein